MRANVSKDIVLVSGTFNICHAGHVHLLEYASQFGYLIVGINGDGYQRAKYGDKAIPAQAREYVLRSIRYVNYVVVFDEENPSELIRQLKPKYYVRGADYRGVQLPEEAALHDVGCQLIITPFEREFSSTRLLGSKSSL